MQLLRTLWLGLVLVLLALGTVAAQTQSQIPPGMQQFSDGNGAPYAGGRVYFYVPGTTTPKGTFLDPNGVTPNTNPVVLDGNGRGIIWGSGLYREVLQDANGNTIWDQLVYGPGGSSSGAGASYCAQSYTTGSANAQAMSTTPSATALVIGTFYCAVAGYSNSGAMTLNVDSLGFKTVKKPTASGLVLLSGGEVQQGQAYLWQWDGAEFVLTNPTVASGSTYNVANFCSVYNGTTDNTGCIQSAINAACAGAGGSVVFPAGKFAISTATGVQITCGGVYLVGQGYSDSENASNSNLGTSIFAINTGGASLIQFLGVSGARIVGGGVRNLTIQETNAGASNPQTGWAIDFEFCLYCMVKDVMVYGAQNNIRVNASSYTAIEHSFLHQVNVGGNAIQFQGNDGSGSCDANLGNCPTRSDSLYISDVEADSQLPQAGLSAGTCLRHIDFAATINAVNLTCGQFQIGYYANCPTSQASGACPSFATLVNFQIESNGTNSGGNGFGVFAEDVQELYLTEPALYGYSSSSGLAIEPGRFSNNGDINVVGGKIQSFQNDCVLIEASMVYFVGVQMLQCGTSTSGGPYYGLELRAGTACSAGSCANFTLSGNTFCTNANGTPNSFPAMNLGNGVSFLTVEGNKFKGCSSGITDGTGSVTKYISTTSNLGP